HRALVQARPDGVSVAPQGYERGEVPLRRRRVARLKRQADQDLSAEAISGRPLRRRASRLRLPAGVEEQRLDQLDRWEQALIGIVMRVSLLDKPVRLGQPRRRGLQITQVEQVVGLPHVEALEVVVSAPLALLQLDGFLQAGYCGNAVTVGVMRLA